MRPLLTLIFPVGLMFPFLIRGMQKESYLQNCWMWAAKKRPLFEEAELIVETLPAITYCEECEKTYSTIEYGKICPHCGSEHTYLLQGSEFNIKEIEVE